MEGAEGSASASNSEERDIMEGPLVMVVMLVGLGLAIPWYLSYSEAAIVEVFQHFRSAFILLPLLLLLALKLLSASDAFEHAEAATASIWTILSSAMDPSPPQQDEGGGGGGSPVIVAIFLGIIFFMLWYQSGFQQYWHPIMRA